MDEFEKTKRQFLQPIFFEAGAGLYDCQAFENCVAYMLYLLSKLGVMGLDPADTAAILDHEAKKTAGQLVAALRKHTTLSEGIEDALANALAARNELIHRFFIQNVERLMDPANRSTIVKEIRVLRFTVQHATGALDPFVKALARGIDGFDIQQIAQGAKNRFLTEWRSDG